MNTELTEKTNDDLLAMTITTIIEIMMTDYAAAYKKTYTTEEEYDALRRRIYARATNENIEPSMLVEAYERLTEYQRFLPSAIDLIAESLLVKHEMKQIERNRKEIDHLVSLPSPPPKTVNPKEAIAEMRRNLGMRRIGE